MKPMHRVYLLDSEDQKFFGEGPYRLLKAIDMHGSLRAAAQSMDMAYTKALKLLRNAENALGFALTARETGGRDGGGSVLTDKGKAFVTAYERYRDACRSSSLSLFDQFFPGGEAAPYTEAKKDAPDLSVGCVIMASGRSARFGSNKLMADFGGRPMICRALDTGKAVFSRLIVITRHKEVAALCAAQRIPFVLHDLPSRSDTVRLGIEAMLDLDAVMFLPGDQPLLREETVRDLLESWKADPQFIHRLSAQDAPGLPSIFPQWAFGELRSLPEGKGGGFVASAHESSVRLHPAKDPSELEDIDTPDDLARLLPLLSPACRGQ